MRIRNMLAAAAACLAFAGAAQADAINTNQWYTFGFGDTGSALFGNCGSCTIGVAGVAAPAAPWTFTLATPMTLFVTDGFIAGDEFELFDFGTSIGSTNVVANGPGACGNDEEACLADPLYSHGAFLLAAGNHSLTGIVTDSPFASGAAFFIIRTATVPEPGTLALLGLALVGATVGRRRRR